MRKVFLLFGLAGMWVMPVRAEDAVKIAVMDVKARQGVDNMVALSLTDLVCTEISEIGGYQVIGRDDMQAMLEHVGDRQLLECDDTKCLAQVGGALGVERLMAGNIGMIGKTYLINFKLIDIDNAEVLNRISQEFAGDESALIPFVRHSVRVLFGAEEQVAAAPQVPVPAVMPLMLQEERKEGRGAIKIVRYSLLGAGVLSAVIAYATYHDAVAMFDDEYNAPDQTDPATLAGIRSDIEKKDLMANVLFGVSGACLLGGGITFAF